MWNIECHSTVGFPKFETLDFECGQSFDADSAVCCRINSFALSFVTLVSC